MSDTLGAPLERMLRLAADLGSTLAGRARASTTLARERAILRLLDVSGLDRAGLPLASAVVERSIGPDVAQLAHGLILPFAVALLEYDVPPRQLALDVASGAVDLRFEAELLADPDRRAAATAEAARLLGRAAERIDANRVARLELQGYLGDALQPWQGARLAAASLDRALDEAAAMVAAGADVVRVHVPANRELIVRRHDLGFEEPAWQARLPAGSHPEEPADVPAGSQRGLARMRARLDEAAAECGHYIRLASSTEALAAPEQALVAALERVDVVEADPVAEIVAGGVDPDRALADHSFAHRLLRRAGVQIVIGAGPLVVAPDLARGVPSSSVARAGRAFALQALAVAIARSDGLDERHLAAGALPAWLGDERDPVTQAMAGVAVRRLAWPDLPLVFEEPAGSARAAARWPHLLAFGMSVEGDSAMVARPGRLDRSLAEGTRAAVGVGRELVARPSAVIVRPAVAEHAAALVAAAEDLLERMRTDGWASILVSRPDAPERPRLGADAVAPLVDADPLDALLEGGPGGAPGHSSY
jgi:hypothetical protein